MGWVVGADGRVDRSFEAGSPRSVPVGPQTDMSSVERRY